MKSLVPSSQNHNSTEDMVREIRTPDLLVSEQRESLVFSWTCLWFVLCVVSRLYCGTHMRQETEDNLTRKCSICLVPKRRAEVDQLPARGESSWAIALETGFSKSSVSRHSRHAGASDIRPDPQTLQSIRSWARIRAAAEKHGNVGSMLLVEMLAPSKGRVYDPCCGSGGMFISSEKFIEAHSGKLGDISIYG
jgi:hypothetical protein